MKARVRRWQWGKTPRGGPAPTPARLRAARHRVPALLVGFAIGLLVVALFALALVDD